MAEEWKFTTKDIAEKPDLFLSGHRACAGCAPATVLRLIMKATRGPTIVTHPTGCLEAAPSTYPSPSPAPPCPHCGDLGFEPCAFCAGAGWADRQSVPPELLEEVIRRQAAGDEQPEQHVSPGPRHPSCSSLR